jgi:hypothetical protein
MAASLFGGSGMTLFTHGGTNRYIKRLYEINFDKRENENIGTDWLKMNM